MPVANLARLRADEPSLSASRPVTQFILGNTIISNESKIIEKRYINTLSSSLQLLYAASQILEAQAIWLRDTDGQALRAGPSHVPPSVVMLCVHSILLPSIVQPSASTGCCRCSTNPAAWKAQSRAIRPTTSSAPVRMPIASRSQWPASRRLISRLRQRRTG